MQCGGDINLKSTRLRLAAKQKASPGLPQFQSLTRIPAEQGYADYENSAGVVAAKKAEIEVRRFDKIKEG